MNTLQDRLMEQAGLIGVVYAIVVLAGIVCGLLLFLRARREGLHWREGVSWLRWRPWYGRELLLLLLLIALLQMLLGRAGAWIEAFATATGLRDDSSLMFFQSIALHIAGFTLVATWLAWRRIPWRVAFGIRLRELPGRFAQGMAYILATMPVLLVYTLLYQMVLQLTGYETDLQDVAYAMSEEPQLWMRVYFVVFATVIAPVFEEILFRGIGLGVLAKRFGTGVSIAIVSVAFALVHGHVPSLVPLFLLSVAFSTAYILTGSLLVPMVMHALFNGLTMVMIMGVGG